MSEAGFKAYIKRNNILVKLAFFVFILSFVYSIYHIIDNVLYGLDLIKELYFYSGIFGLLFLFLSLFFALFKSKYTKNYPRILGIFCGIWIFIHFFVYFVLSKNFNVFKLLQDITQRVFEASGFIAFVLIFLMFLSSFKKFKKLSKIRKLGYLCLLLASYHYFLSAKVPMFWEYLVLILAIFFFVFRYTKRYFFGGDEGN
ncbi:MAG: sulfite oxidase heme-binding subunit YedZ [Campylobacter sp.]|nr:sulfite oxidase heme-binding subunit YedZ [Campylobacter sp.]